MTSNNNSGLLNQSAATNASMQEDESIYVLPKTYNGKTVTELFPEFEYDSVLRFSKLFGVGRVTSLPKIWKGVRKRKKQQRIDGANRSLSMINETLNEENRPTLRPIPEEPSTSGANNNDDDVFRLFEQDFRLGERFIY